MRCFIIRGVELFEAKTEVQEMSNYIKDEF